MNSISAKNRSSLNKSYLLRTIGSVMATTTSTSTSTSSNQMNSSRFNSNTNSSSTSVVGDNGIDIDMHTKHYWALVLLIIPVLTLFGNLLVICSVVRYRNLHSAINYFILGLAFADLMVALAVMPFAVYVEFNNGIWELGGFMCDLYCAADVTCSTASIFLLTIISFDRYMAATQPIKYVNKSKGVVHVALINMVVWFVSMLIASPMVLGLNNVPNRKLNECRFYNADFIIYSSAGSFCIPLVFMFYLYARIYQVIRRRSKSSKERHKSSAAAMRNPSTSKNNFDNQNYQQQTNNTTTTKDKDESKVVKNDPVTDAEALKIGSEMTMTKVGTTTDSGHPPSPPVPSDEGLHGDEVVHDGEEVHERLLPKEPTKSFSTCSSKSDDKIFVNSYRRTSELCKPFFNENESCHSLISAPKNQLPADQNILNATLKGRRSSSWMPNMKPAIASTLRTSMASVTPDEKKILKRISTQSSSSDSIESSSDSTNHEVLVTDVSTFYANIGGMVLTKIQQRQKEMIANGAIQNTRHDRQASIGNLLHRRKMSRKAYKSAKKEKKATKTLAIVLGVFLLCWLPFFTLNLINAICMKLNVKTCQIGFLPFFLTTWFGYMNSVMNPVIYTVFNLEFRRAFKQCLCPYLNRPNNQPRRV